MENQDNPWDAVFASYPTDANVQRYQPARRVNALNKVLGLDLANRDPHSTDYCACGRCQPMTSPVEAFCCTEVFEAQTSPAEKFKKFFHQHQPCICANEIIKNVVENETELKLFIDTCKWLGNPEDDDIDLLTKNYRFALYKKLTLLIHGPKEANERLPLPSCLVSFVRSKYPEEDGEYTGFVDY